MTDRHKLGGRSFLTVQDATVEQDFLFLELIHNAHIDRIVLSEGEDAAEFSERILGALVGDGAVLKLLGCLLVPAAAPTRRLGFRRDTTITWTPELGAETARFLGGLKSPEDKAKIRALVLTLLVHFFENGIVSLWTTKTSSGEAIPDPDQEPETTSSP